MDCSMPGFSVYHQLLELAQTHVHRVGDTIQPSHPLLFPSPPATLQMLLETRVGVSQCLLALSLCPLVWIFTQS